MLVGGLHIECNYDFYELLKVYLNYPSFLMLVLLCWNVSKLRISFWIEISPFDALNTINFKIRCNRAQVTSTFNDTKWVVGLDWSFVIDNGVNNRLDSKLEVCLHGRFFEFFLNTTRFPAITFSYAFSRFGKLLDVLSKNLLYSTVVCLWNVVQTKWKWSRQFQNMSVFK